MVQFDINSGLNHESTLESSDHEKTAAHGAFEATDQGRAWCQRFGMTDIAWDGWCKMHVNPIVGIRWFFGVETGNLLCFLYIFSALPLDGSTHFYVFALPLSTALTSSATLSALMWRVGPKVVKHPMCIVLLVVYILGSCPLLLLGYVWPPSALSWNNRAYFVCVHGSGVLFALHAAAAGKFAGEHPQQPRTSITRAVIPPCIRTLQMMDSLTHMSVIRTFIQAKGESCWWYGMSGRCHAWDALIVILSVCAIIDFTAVLAVVLIGKEATSKNREVKRMSTGLELLCLLCELGGVVCTLLYLFNLKRSTSTGYSGLDADEAQKQISFTFVSVSITIVTATVRMVGVSNVLRAVRSAAASVRSSTSMAAEKSQFFDAHRGSVMPAYEDDKEGEEEEEEDLPMTNTWLGPEDTLLTSVTDTPNTLAEGHDGDVLQSSARRPSVAGLRPGGSSDA